MRIRIDVDAAAFQAQVDGPFSASLDKAAAGAINDAAAAAVEALRQEAEESFDKPSDFTLQAFRFLQARPGDSRPAALVNVAPIQARFLELEVDGGPRRAGDYATTALGPLVPGPDAPKDARGNLPRGYVTRAMMQEHVRWTRLKPGAPPALVRQPPGRPMEILALIVREAEYEPRLDFLETVRKAVKASLAPAFAKRLEAGHG